MSDSCQPETKATEALDPRLRAGDLVLSDFDGTVTLRDTGWVVFDALGLKEAWDWEYRWRDGEISSMECLAGQWGLVDVPREELLEIVDNAGLDEAFGEFVKRARAAGAEVVVLSDGLDFYLDRMLARVGFSICPEDPEPGDDSCLTRYVNHGEFTEEGIQITFPHRDADCDLCGNCKSAHLERLRRCFERVIYIGDGYSDRCPAERSDLVFAKDHLAQLLDEKGLLYLPFESFDDIIEAMFE